MRKLLLFLAMVAAGLTALLLLADEPGAGAGGGAITGRAAPSGPALGLTGANEQRETRVRMGEVDFPVLRPLEVSPGVIEQREAYRVHVKEARPGADGRFELDQPVITLLDPLSGEWRGELQGDTGWILTDQSGAGDLHLQLDALHADTFAIEGDVRGRLATEGGMAHLAAHSLTARGPVVTAPGEVRWWRDDLSLTGMDMTLDETRQQLSFARDAVLELPEGGAGPSGTLSAAGGLTWSLPEREEARGHGALLGPVRGHTSGGGELSCERLLVNADESAFTLLGTAFVEQPGEWNGRADEMTVADDGRGSLELVSASGDVRVEQLDAGNDSWLEAPALQQQQRVLVAQGPVRWHRSGVDGRSADLRWGRDDGRLTASAGVRLEVSAGGLAGASLQADGGLDLSAPPGAVPWLSAARGELAGPVSGSLPTGEHFSCERVQLDGPDSGLTLLGQVHAERDDGSDLFAERVALLADERGQLSDLSAAGAVHWRGPPSEKRLEFRTERLERTGQRISSPEWVQANQGALQLAGQGLNYDERTGVLEIPEDAKLAADTGAGQGLATLNAAAGLTWKLPADRSLGAEAGTGELRGPVRGQTPDGRRLVAQRVLADGAAQRLSLRGAARVSLDPSHWLEGERLDVDLRPGSRAIDSPGAVRFAAGRFTGQGSGLHHDEASGRVKLAHDVQVRFVDELGRQRLALACDGLLSFTAPPDANDPLRAGSGEAHDGVVAVDDAGSRLQTDQLLLDGPNNQLTALGPSSLQLPAASELATLRANRRLALRQNAEGVVVLLEAEGKVTGDHDAAGETLHFEAEAFAADRLTRALTFDGPSLLTRVRDGERSSLTGRAGSRLVALTDEHQQLLSVAGTGGFLFENDSFQAHSERLDWDLPGDHALLDGDCRLLGLTGWVMAPRVELWPRARRSFVPQPAIVLDGER